MPSTQLSDYAWPVSRLGELIEALARRSGLSARPKSIPRPPVTLASLGDEQIGRWIDVAAGDLGLEAETIQAMYPEVEDFVRAGGPAIIRLPGDLGQDEPLLLAVLKGRGRSVLVITPDHKERRLSIQRIRDALCFPFESMLLEPVDQLLVDAEVPPARLQHARSAILREQLGPLRITGGWMLRPSPGSPLLRQYRYAHLFRPMIALLVIYILQQVLTLVSWYLIGRGVFQGNFDLAWLSAWGILLFAGIPLQILVSDAQSVLSMGGGTIFKQRLLHGTLKLESDEIRHQGMGQFLGRVMDSDAVEMLALSGGFTAVLAVIELVMAGWVLSKGAGGMMHVGLLLVWSIFTALILWRYFQSTRDWSTTYRKMTNDLVERMVGHRTRLAQEDRRHWHDEEDRMLEEYLSYSEGLDRLGAQLQAFISRGWLVVGLAGVAYAFVATPEAAPALAVSLGGVLMASGALGRMAAGSQSLAGIVIAWEQVGPLFNAAARPRDSQALDFVFSPGDEGQAGAQRQDQASLLNKDRQPVVSARDLNFRYSERSQPVLQGCSLQVYEGDRILLEGPSGGGKTTLAAILTGLRRADTGSLLLWGFDRQILGGEEWRRRVIMAPQFQENHVFAETFAFNLLMGRHWPPRSEDLQEAEQICHELGLGELLGRMPSGLQQIVGESGWQLSHGERSRLFIARTLLQDADLVILDESFGALDPENLGRSMRCVLQRAKTLLVIAHP
jgi:ATP-binding cassette subfamily B protein